MIHLTEIGLETRGDGDMHDLTRDVAGIVRESGITTGIVHVFNVGSTGALGTIEFEPGLQRDLPEILDRLIPPSREYGHEQTWHDGNGHSHLQASWLGPDLTVPLREGELVQAGDPGTDNQNLGRADGAGCSGKHREETAAAVRCHQYGFIAGDRGLGGKHIHTLRT